MIIKINIRMSYNILESTNNITPFELTYRNCLEFYSTFENIVMEGKYDVFKERINFLSIHNKYDELRDLSNVITSLISINNTAVEMKALFKYICSTRELHSKIYNSSNEVIKFIDKILKDTDKVDQYFKDFMFILPKSFTNLNNLFVDVFYNCFQDIYALKYIVTNPPQHYFYVGKVFKVLDIIYMSKTQELEDEDKWIMITSDDDVKLYYHPLLPYPEDFKLKNQDHSY